MATKKTTKKQPRALTAKEKDRFFEMLDKARRHAWKVSKDQKYNSEVRRSFASIEKKLGKIKIDYFWGRMTNYS